MNCFGMLVLFAVILVVVGLVQVGFGMVWAAILYIWGYLR